MKAYSKMTAEELAIVAANGKWAESAMTQSGFFKDVFVSGVEEDLVLLTNDLAWKPGATDSTMEKVAMDRIWKSGIIQGVGMLWKRMNDLKNQGRDAEKEMGLRAKK